VSASKTIQLALQEKVSQKILKKQLNSELKPLIAEHPVLIAFASLSLITLE